VAAVADGRILGNLMVYSITSTLTEASVERGIHRSGHLAGGRFITNRPFWESYHSHFPTIWRSHPVRLQQTSAKLWSRSPRALLTEDGIGH
jgi:hypothetical protein